MHLYGITHKSTKLLPTDKFRSLIFSARAFSIWPAFYDCVNRVSSGSASNAADPCWPLFHFPIGYFSTLTIINKLLECHMKAYLPNLFDVVLIAKIFLMFRYNHKLFITLPVIVMVKYFLALTQINGSQK